MLISDIYSPTLLQGSSAEETIFTNGLNDFYEEIRRVIFDTKVVISPRITEKKGDDATGAPGLAAALNEALGTALTSLSWAELKSPGGTDDHNTLDWFKSKKPHVAYVPGELGLGIEIQFGNNYQYNEDIKRLTEAFLAGKIVAGISIVPSDVLAKHKADRGCFFSDAKNKLDRHYETMYGSGAKKIPPILIIGIQQDGYNTNQEGYFEITPVRFTTADGKITGSTKAQMLTNASKTSKRGVLAP